MSSKNKKYYWLKLPDDFFQNPKIKKLRKIAGGDTYTIIYQDRQFSIVPKFNIFKKITVGLSK